MGHYVIFCFFQVDEQECIPLKLTLELQHAALGDLDIRRACARKLGCAGTASGNAVIEVGIAHMVPHAPFARGQIVYLYTALFAHAARIADHDRNIVAVTDRKRAPACVVAARRACVRAEDITVQVMQHDKRKRVRGGGICSVLTQSILGIRYLKLGIMEGTPREGLEITEHTVHLTVHCKDITGRIEQIVVQVTCCRAFSPLVHEQRRTRQTVLAPKLLVKLRYHAVTLYDTGLLALLDESGAQKIAAGADIVMVIRIKIYGRLLGLCLGKQLEKAVPEVDPYKRTRNAVAAYQKRDIVSARLVECLYRTVRSHINLVIFLAVERTEGRKLRLVAAFYVFYIGSYRLAVIHSVGKYLAVLLIA